MSSDLAIRVDGLGKAYTIRHHQSDHVTLAQVALERARHPFRRHEREQFWALRDVGFEVNQGEVLGVIGRNGAGKSTLLKMLTRISTPTEGRIDLWGRVGSLLEVGTGFHPELTGRENIFLNGTILGMSRKEINRQFDAIVAFAGVEKFLDTPVKRYSSGMYVRLAFAVAAHLQTEILLVDEVLAVGDQEFQKKCLGKMHDVAADGRTVLFVSHQVSSIRTLCDRALLLENGTLRFAGPVAETLDAYHQSMRAVPKAADPRRRSGPLRITHVDLSAEPVTPDAPKVIRFTVTPRNARAARYYVTANVVDAEGAVVAQCDSRLSGTWIEPDGPQDITLTLRSPWLLPGEYRVDLVVISGWPVDRLEGATTIVVTPEVPYPGAGASGSLDATPVLPDFVYQVTAGQLHPADTPA